MSRVTMSRDKDKGTVVKVMREFIPREIHQTHTGSWSVVNYLPIPRGFFYKNYSKKYFNYKAHPVHRSYSTYKGPSSKCSPWIQAFYTAELDLQHPTVFPGFQ